MRIEVSKHIPFIFFVLNVYFLQIKKINEKQFTNTKFPTIFKSLKLYVIFTNKKISLSYKDTIRVNKSLVEIFYLYCFL